MSAAFRRRAPALVALAWLASSTVAAAAPEVDSFGGVDLRRAAESEQSFAFELRFGPYVPDVDRQFGGNGPFNRIFGDGRRWMIGGEFDWQALRIPHFGSLGPGIGIGYTTASGNARFESTGLPARETNTFNTLPLALNAVLRIDVLARETRVPLAAYAKLGLGAGLWWVDGTSDSANAKAISAGYQWAVGAMFLLDWLDPVSSKELDNSLGINNSYVFFEWLDANYDGFGGKQVQVGARTWALGLAFEL